jgi:2-keto-4-pentenoate hydratase
VNFKKQGGKESTESAEETNKRGTEHELQTYAGHQQGPALSREFLANSLQDTHHGLRAGSSVIHGQCIRIT